ncbi:uncharacterized protein EDB93DRAFT_1302755 [Suillus bovinus]|uniref:uncharacterized protein n=1 Tax=Suillus bovinus TaxID=48563 RepID=UPI001B85E9A5|nr:uncharacterized protein EDB93DRAFT_1302755 [Suillus bovinus]KAG2136983.1 hypothetical protein EDB93DRAFT_1302755 [Suillus bovinus]
MHTVELSISASASGITSLAPIALIYPPGSRFRMLLVKLAKRHTWILVASTESWQYINVSSTDPSKWDQLKIVSNHQVFDTAESFMDVFHNGILEHIPCKTFLGVHENLKPQEVFAQYTGNNPYKSSTVLLDSYFGMGQLGYQLVIKSIATVGNFRLPTSKIRLLSKLFLVVCVSASGYLLSGFWDDEQRAYGNKIWNTTYGSLHDHVINFKVFSGEFLEDTQSIQDTLPFIMCTIHYIECATFQGLLLQNITQQDLVTWINVRTHHLPASEDVPNTRKPVTVSLHY